MSYCKDRGMGETLKDAGHAKRNCIIKDCLGNYVINQRIFNKIST